MTLSPINFQQAEPLLYDELVRRQQLLLSELEKKKVDSWETLEQQDPDTAMRLWNHLQRSKILPNLEMLQQLDRPHDGMSPKEYATDFYNKSLFHVYNCLTRAIEGNIENIFRLGEHYQKGNDVPEDPLLAFRLVRLAAEQGYQPAFSVLGKYYTFGIGTPKNPEESARWLLQTDYSQDVDALAILAWCYQTGTGVPQNEQKAWDYWLDAAQQGHSNGFRICQAVADAGYAKGQFFLGYYYQHGIGTPTDIQTALRLYHLAADQGYVHAQCRLGILYGEGNYGIEKDSEIAVQWLRLAATQNDPVARSRLADCLVSGNGVEQNIEEAIQILKTLAQESSEYPKGEPFSQFRLGALLTNEELVEYNPKEGVKWLRKSAEQDSSQAQNSLGLLYYKGLEGIVKPNLKEARLWFNKAAKQGEYQAQYYLGEIFFNGEGVPANCKEAVKWYKQSSDNGYVPAQQKLAHCYLNGIGTKKNESDGCLVLASLASWGDEEAMTMLQCAATSGNPAAEFGMWAYHRDKNDMDVAHQWLEKSAEQMDGNALYTMALRYEYEENDAQKLRYLRLAAEKGNAEAQSQLGIALENVHDKKAPENEEAFKWIKAAADQGHAQANYFLGNFYRSGTWVEADGQQAFECYSKAAEQGNADGIERLGECYANGTGVPMDENIAFQYMQRAAELGNPKGLCHLGLYYLNGIGCRQDTELAFRWISQAIDTGFPIVFQILEGVGLDITKLSGGIKQFRQYQSAMTGDMFGEDFDQIFNNPRETILPMAPGEKN